MTHSFTNQIPQLSDQRLAPHVTNNRIECLEHSFISINQLNYLFTVLQSGVKQLLVCQWMSLLECISHKTNFSFPSSLTVLENETSGKTKETFFLGLIHHFHPADTHQNHITHPFSTHQNVVDINPIYPFHPPFPAAAAQGDEHSSCLLFPGNIHH